jgi:hypothetical protein
MTFHCHTKDDKGNPVAGILVSACLLRTGQTFQRSSDGAGYSDLAVLGGNPGDDVLLSVVKEGYGVWTEYTKLTATDQEVSVSLVPFVE